MRDDVGGSELRDFLVLEKGSVKCRNEILHISESQVGYEGRP